MDMQDTSDLLWDESPPDDMLFIVGGRKHVVHINKIPYFQKLLKYKSRSGQLLTTEIPTCDDKLPYFCVVNDMVKLGLHRAFHSMPLQLGLFFILCETMDFLGVNPLQGDGDDPDRIVRNMVTHEAFTGPYSDQMGVAAFKLLYIFLFRGLRRARTTELALMTAPQQVMIHLYKVPNFMDAWGLEHGWLVKKLVLEAFERQLTISRALQITLARVEAETKQLELNDRIERWERMRLDYELTEEGFIDEL
ncbi:hypothetical protein GE09DRAFT_34098 [Coniochaeta sp. 2T2.1]|nr:hypothetical protein GE09DRAFT_34098 [Coniochaeta sp. 2T2.1]